MQQRSTYVPPYSSFVIILFPLVPLCQSMQQLQSSTHVPPYSSFVIVLFPLFLFKDNTLLCNQEQVQTGNIGLSSTSEIGCCHNLTLTRDALSNIKKRVHVPHSNVEI